MVTTETHKAMTKEHIYKGNKILEYEDGSFLATKYANGEVDSKTVKSLKQAKAFIDKDSEKDQDELEHIYNTI